MDWQDTVGSENLSEVCCNLVQCKMYPPYIIEMHFRNHNAIIAKSSFSLYKTSPDWGHRLRGWEFDIFFPIFQRDKIFRFTDFFELFQCGGPGRQIIGHNN